MKAEAEMRARKLAEEAALAEAKKIEEEAEARRKELE